MCCEAVRPAGTREHGQRHDSDTLFCRRCSMQLHFDRGTLLLRGTLNETAGLPGLVWDPRVVAWRAPACYHSALSREPEPVESGEFLVFPDFAVVHRHDTSRRFLLEIVGFWTPDYLREKLSRLRAMPNIPLVLCIDRGLNCSAGELPPHARVVWFQKRIDPGAVLAVIDKTAPESVTCVERIGIGDLFINWAGRFPPSDPVHRRLAELKAGREVRLRKHSSGIAIEAEGGPIAMLSRPACARWLARLDRVVSGTLVKLTERQAAQSAPQWRSSLRCDRWTVPVVDVRFARADDG